MNIPDSYLIEVFLTPENPQKETSPYFWCILKCQNGNYSNEGSGWADSPHTAYHDAYNYFEEILHPSLILT